MEKTKKRKKSIPPPLFFWVKKKSGGGIAFVKNDEEMSRSTSMSIKWMQMKYKLAKEC